MRPSNDEIFSIAMAENNYPDLYSEYYEYHLNQLMLMNKYINMNVIEENEAIETDDRYYQLYDRIKKVIIYKISSKNHNRIYIGSTTNPLMCRYVGHLHDAKHAPDSISSYKIIKYGDTKIELLEEQPFAGNEKEILELEKKHMRIHINILVNWRKELREAIELIEDYRNGIELKYYIEVDLTETQEEEMRRRLIKWYKTKIPPVSYVMNGEGNRKIEKLRDGLAKTVRSKFCSTAMYKQIVATNAKNEEIDRLLAKI